MAIHRAEGVGGGEWGCGRGSGSEAPERAFALGCFVLGRWLWSNDFGINMGDWRKGVGDSKEGEPTGNKELQGTCALDDAEDRARGKGPAVRRSQGVKTGTGGRGKYGAVIREVDHKHTV